MAADPARPSTVRVGLVYPDLLGTYGDSGNAVILSQRLRWRGQPAEVVQINAGDSVPDSCDLYVIGGGEDLPQALAASDLNAQRSLHRAVDQGAVVLAVCAGLQILGRTFVGPDGVEQPGLGLLDCVTVRGKGRRAVGELVVDPTAAADLPLLSGYENHGGVTMVGTDARPLGLVRVGVGNGAEATTEANAGAPAPPPAAPSAGGLGPAVDGAVSGRIWSTYMHGPVLARNPVFADRLLGLVVGSLAPLDDSESEALRAERLQAVDARRGWSRPGAARWREAWDRARRGRRPH